MTIRHVGCSVGFGVQLTRAEHGKLAQHPPWQSLLLLVISPVRSESAGCESQVVPISDSDLDGTLQSCCMSVSSMSHVETFDFASNEYLVPRVLLADTLLAGAASHTTVGRSVSAFVGRAHAHSEQSHENA